MVTYAGCVILTLTAVCLIAALPQHRITPVAHFDIDEYERVVWGSEERTSTKRISTPANIPRPGVTKPNTRKSQRLTTVYQLEQDNDTRPRQRSTSATNRGIQVEQDGARQPNRTIPKIVGPGVSIGSSSQHLTQNGGSGGRTTTAQRGAVGHVTIEGEGSRETTAEGRGNPVVCTNGSRDDIEVAASQDTGARSRHVDSLAAERNLPRWESNKGTRVKNGDIVFPGPSHDDKRNDRIQFTPLLVNQRPCCAMDSEYCDKDQIDYPVLHLNRKLKEQGVVFRNFFSSDEPDPVANNISQRIDTSQESPICLSKTEIVYPKVAQNMDNEWLFIVNLDDEKYKQGIRVETCSNPDEPCAYSESFPFSVETFCKQKYIYRHMLALAPDGSPSPGSFKMPSCCVCHTRDKTMSRKGGDPNR